MDSSERVLGTPGGLWTVLGSHSTKLSPMAEHLGSFQFLPLMMSCGSPSWGRAIFITSLSVEKPS